MSNTFTLDSMREELEKEFAPVELVLPDESKVILRSLLRTPRRNRKMAFEVLEKIQSVSVDGDEEAKDTDTLSQMAEFADLALQLFALVADTEAGGLKLVSSIEDDMPLVFRVFEAWMESTQAGEAVSSAS